LEQEDKKPEELPKTPANKVIKRGKKIGMKTPKSLMKLKNVEAIKAEESKKADGAENEKKPLKLPEAFYSEIEDYDITDAPKRSNTYYRFIEKSPEEMDEMVEYDMDEEDVAWLNLINEKRSQDGQARIMEDQFELLMDRLEKESYFHVQTNGKDYRY
jgi:bromodomain and PHD finger-containing protein 1